MVKIPYPIRFYLSQWDNIFKSSPASYDPFQKDTAFIQIYFNKPTVIQMKSKSAMAWIDYLSTVGGLSGLLLGMGFISFIELMWLCYKIMIT